ncbi:SLC13 family permease, partial [Luminiphilus sp.]|nr:SLC13 family permease [Luminiphilus sp.]
MEPLLTALIVVVLILTLIFSRAAPALVFTSAMAACVMVGSIELQTALDKATNQGLITLILLILVSIG